MACYVRRIYKTYIHISDEVYTNPSAFCNEGEQRKKENSDKKLCYQQKN